VALAEEVVVTFELDEDVFEVVTGDEDGLLDVELEVLLMTELDDVFGHCWSQFS